MEDIEEMQRVYNVVKKHLLAQRKRAEDSFNGCRYRDDSAGRMLKCAIGCLIKDEVYNPNIEGKSVKSRQVQSQLKASGVDVGVAPIDFWSRLQAVHDRRDPEEWEQELGKLANSYCLQP